MINLRLWLAESVAPPIVVRFVGGTGRFAGAHGTGTGIVDVNLLTGAFEITIVGDINF